MSTYPMMQVDAFTERPLAGNPCAVIFESDNLSDAQMLAIAKEMNLSETSFVRQSQVADFGVRYFTPAEEIPLAGHPTIATTFALIDSGRLLLDGDYTVITFELQVGPITIEIFAKENVVQRIMMSQKKPQFLEILDPNVVMPAFNLQADDVLPNAPIQIVSTGTPQLMVPVKDLDVLRRIQLDVSAYIALRESTGFFSPHHFCLQSVTEEGTTFARHFGVPPDTMEDPFTGSATGGMAAFLWHHGLIDSPTFIADQGHWMNRPGQAFVEVVGPRDDIETVKVGGTAVTVLRGELYI
ncbi:MAG: PhzF family phenazine biosynthesis protein [Chloroflexi bacterium]|nr:PhzF family phenazine biosynthesis protein [Chloroflexota bacterium]